MKSCRSQGNSISCTAVASCRNFPQGMASQGALTMYTNTRASPKAKITSFLLKKGDFTPFYFLLYLRSTPRLCPDAAAFTHLGFPPFCHTSRLSNPLMAAGCAPVTKWENVDDAISSRSWSHCCRHPSASGSQHSTPHTQALHPAPRFAFLAYHRAWKGFG